MHDVAETDDISDASSILNIFAEEGEEAFLEQVGQEWKGSCEIAKIKGILWKAL